MAEPDRPRSPLAGIADFSARAPLRMLSPDDVESSNSSGYDQIIGAVMLTLDGNVVSSTPAVPEPGTISLLASGLGAVFFVVRRRRRVR
jgi:hypothetical protein